MKAQAAVEMIVILAVGMSILLVIISINDKVMTSTYSRIESTKAKTAIESLSEAAELVYQQGVGSRTRVFLTLPQNIQSFNVSQQSLIMQLYTGGSLKEAYRTLDFNVSGNLPINEGNYWICITSMENYVAIYDCANETLPQCGNNITEDGEDCDGSDLGDYSSDCSTYPGFNSGTLSCNPDCTFNTNDCTVALPAISLALFSPTTNTNFTRNLFNEFTVNLSCFNADCGEVNLSLDPANWWDASWQHRKVINITNNDGSDVLRKGYSINFTINTTISNDFLANGNDLRIVWVNGTTNIELDRINATAFNSATTEIWFKLQANISAGSYDDSYYIYYNNSNAGTPPTNRSKVFYFADDFDRSNRDLGGDNGWTKTVFGTFDADIVSNYATIDYSGDWWSSSDSAGWIWQDFTYLDDWEATVYLIQDTSDTYQRIGVAVRNTPTSANSEFFTSLVRGGTSNSFSWVKRASAGAFASWPNWQSVTGDTPLYIKMTKIGTTYTLYISDDDEFSGYNVINSGQSLTSANYVGIPGAGGSGNNIMVDDFKIRMLLSAEPSVQLGAEENQTAAKGLISTTAGAVPFYTNKSGNPFTISLNQNQSQLVTFWINATGSAGSTYVFFAYANLTDNMSINNITNKINITVVELADTTPPKSVTNLENQSQGLTWIYWNWTNPMDADFNHTEVWINETFYVNVSAPDNYYNATSLTAGTTYEIQTRTVDTNGNINTTWVNDTAKTLVPSENITIFYDGFENWGGSNCQHNGMWNFCYQGDGNIARDNDEYNGSRAVRFDDHDADINYLIKCEDLSFYSRAYITFWWKKSGLDYGEYGKLDINTTDSGYVKIFDSGTGSSSYAEEVIDITGFISMNTCIKFHALADFGTDRIFIDDFRIIGET